MRWIPFLLLAACARHGVVDYDRASGSTRPTLLSRLRSINGDVAVISGDRYYVVRAGTLEPEVRAFAGAVADAIETAPLPRDDFPVVADSPVLAFPWLDRGLDAPGLLVECIRTNRGTCLWVTVELERNRYLYAEASGTAATDAAWTRLAVAARDLASEGAGAVPTVAGGPYFFRWGVDTRGRAEARR